MVLFSEKTLSVLQANSWTFSGPIPLLSFPTLQRLQHRKEWMNVNTVKVTHAKQLRAGTSKQTCQGLTLNSAFSGCSTYGEFVPQAPFLVAGAGYPIVLN